MTAPNQPGSRTRSRTAPPTLAPAPPQQKGSRRALLLPRERSLKPALALMAVFTFSAVAYISVHAFSTGESYELRRLSRAIRAERDRHESLVKERARLLSAKSLSANGRSRGLEYAGPPDDDLELSR